MPFLLVNSTDALQKVHRGGKSWQRDVTAQWAGAQNFIISTLRRCDVYRRGPLTQLILVICACLRARVLQLQKTKKGAPPLCTKRQTGGGWSAIDTERDRESKRGRERGTDASCWGAGGRAVGRLTWDVSRQHEQSLACQIGQGAGGRQAQDGAHLQTDRQTERRGRRGQSGGVVLEIGLGLKTTV